MKIKFTIFVCLMTAAALCADNWSAWRGPEQNSISKENNLKLEKPLNKIAWEKNLGLGYSVVSVYGDKLLTAGYSENRDYIYCLNAKSGEQIWVYSYASEKGNKYYGPRSTPVTNGKYVYQFSQTGLLVCLDFNTGKLIWQVDVVKKSGAEQPMWGFASNPVILDDKVIINAGKYGMAFDIETGKAKWKNQGGEGNYSSIKPFVFKNKNYIAFMSKKEICILDIGGNLITSEEWETKYNIVCIDPVINNDGSLILISSAYNTGSGLFKFDGKALNLLWKNSNLCSHFSTPILIEEKSGEGTLYGVNGNAGQGKLCAIDFKTGKNKWNANVRFGNMIMAGDKIIYNTERGELVVFEPNPNEYKEISSGKALNSSGKCWNIPVIANGYLYIKSDSGDLVCFDVK